MKKLKTYLLSIVCLIFGLTGYSQNCNYFIGSDSEIDLLGLRKDEITGTIEEVSCDLKDVFQLESVQFEIFTSSLYSVSKYSQGTTAAIQQIYNEANSISSNNLTFIFLIDDKGALEIRSSISFNDSNYSCIRSQTIQNWLDQFSLINKPQTLNEALLHVRQMILELTEIFFEGFCCSSYFNLKDDHPQNEKSSTCLDYENVLWIIEKITNEEFVNTAHALVETYQNCQNSNWAPKHDKGIMPDCLQPSFLIADIEWAKFAGSIDGIYSFFFDFVNTVKIVPGIYNSLQDILEAYTIGYIGCLETAEGKDVTILEIKKAFFDAYSISSFFNGSTHQERFQEFKDSFVLNTTSVGCKTYDEIRTSTEEFLKLIAEKETYLNLWSKVSTFIGNIWENVSGFTAEHAYWQSYYVMKGIAEFYAGAGIKKFAEYTTNVLGSFSTKLNAAKRFSNEWILSQMAKKYPDETVQLLKKDFIDKDPKILMQIWRKDLVGAWEKVRKGGIDDFINRSEYIPTLEKVTKYQNEVLGGTSGNVKYYRVQGGQGTGTSQELLTVQSSGNLKFNSTSNNLNLSTTTREHADYFIKCCRPGGKIIEFEVPKSLDVQMKEAAIPQYKAKQNLLNQNGSSPKIVDPLQPGNPFELPSHWHQLIEQNYIKGSGKIIN